MTNQDSINASENMGPSAEESTKTRAISKGKLEAIAIVIMVLGYIMIFQTFSMTIYTYSFLVILAGTIMFIIVSHFSDD